MISKRKARIACFAILVVLCGACSLSFGQEKVEVADAFLNNIDEDGDGNLQSLLVWAIEHSSPDALSKMAQDVDQGLSDSTLEQKRERLAALMQESGKFPSRTEVMNSTIQIIASSEESEETRINGLRYLKDLVEDIDAANELPRLGGVDALADAMLAGGELRIAALQVLATAAANNVDFQVAFLQREAGTVPWLLQIASDALFAQPPQVKVLGAALRAAAAMSRNLPPASTGVLIAHVPHLKPLEAPPPSAAAAPDSLPESLKLLYTVAIRLEEVEREAAGMGEDGALGWQKALPENAALGLLSDLAANSADARVVLQGEESALAWQELCQAIPSRHFDLMQRAAELLQSIHQQQDGAVTSPGGPWKSAMKCLTSFVAKAYESAPDSARHESATESLQPLQALVQRLQAGSHDEL